MPAIQAATRNVVLLCYLASPLMASPAAAITPRESR